MPFVQVPGLRMHYEQAGSGKRTLLLVHGNFASWRWWRSLLQQPPEGFQVFAPELRGCGDTDKPDSGYHVEQLAEDLAYFIDALNLSYIDLVGHSLGGAVVTQFALDHPHYIRTLSLINPAPPEGMPDLQNDHSLLFGFKLPNMTGQPIFHQFLRDFRLNQPALQQGFRKMLPELEHQDKDFFQTLVNDALRLPPEANAGFVRSLSTWSVQERLHECKLPVWILGGERDRVVAQDALERAAAALSHGYLQVWENCGHAPMLEEDEQFRKSLLDFVDQSSASSFSGRHSSTSVSAPLLTRLQQHWQKWKHKYR